MIVLEIIELNFCGFNKNTKRNISQRGINELLDDNGRDTNIIDINKDYYIDKNNEDGKKDVIELNEKLYNDKVYEA